MLATLARSGGTIYSDEVNHASIIDGCRLSRATSKVYHHSDCDHLDSPQAQSADSIPGIVISDVVFSMDGDNAPVEDLIDGCARHGALLVLDEAHSVLDRRPTTRPSRVTS